MSPGPSTGGIPNVTHQIAVGVPGRKTPRLHESDGDHLEVRAGGPGLLSQHLRAAGDRHRRMAPDRFEEVEATVPRPTGWSVVALRIEFGATEPGVPARAFSCRHTSSS